jgi:phosphoenolpyruvate---glycerone phosphotransferase subunit DhaL
MSEAERERTMQSHEIAAVIEATARVVRERAKDLDELDEAIGDGDHGTNLARGFAALLERKEALSSLPVGEALMRSAALLQETVPGPLGPIYGALLVEMGRATPDGCLEPEGLAFMLEAGVAGVRRTGRVVPGQKTILDVLAPVADALRIAVDAGRHDEIGARIVAAAATGLHRTSKLVAMKGRAAEIKEKSLHHIDPGACSAALLIGAVVSVLEPQPA